MTDLTAQDRELIERLRGLASAQHDDLSVVQEAADHIKELTHQLQRATDCHQDTVCVQQGDTLWSIAEQLTGHGHNYPALVEINRRRLPNGPHLIFSG